MYDDAIDARLRALHQRQRMHGDVQHEIDRHLIACTSIELKALVLPRNQVPHYDNLPDISAYAIGILDPRLDSDPELQQVLLLLRQCTPLRRRTKRAQREVQWREESLHSMQTLVRCMQGTLLGLYPHSLKPIAFHARVELVRFVRTLLVLPFRTLHRCMQRIPYIVKLCVMEHLCNTVYDYHPGICRTLNRSGQKIEHFCNSVCTICDIFRGELNTLYCSAASETAATAQRPLLLLPLLERLEKVAHSYFERCTRAYRGIIVGSVQPLRGIDHARRFFAGQAPLLLTRELLDRIYPSCSRSVFDVVHARLLPLPAQREAAWHLTQVVQVHALPRCVLERQRVALEQRYAGDPTCVARCRILHLCIQCVIRRSSAQGTRLRHDCLTDELTCMHCGSGAVLTIDMLGRLVTIANDHLFLSLCCGSFVYYSGSGHEFSTTCGVQCAGAQQLYRKRERASSSSSSSSTSAATTTTGSSGGVPLCLVCRQRATIQQTVSLLDPVQRAMRAYPLCSKHVVPQHILRRIYDKDGLLRFFLLAGATATATTTTRSSAGERR